MEILTGLAMVFIFILGFGIGITIPYFIKKYIKEIKEETVKRENTGTIEKISEESIKPKNYTQEQIDEWMNGRKGGVDNEG